jgi:hypothetical protein
MPGPQPFDDLQSEEVRRAGWDDATDPTDGPLSAITLPNLLELDIHVLGQGSGCRAAYQLWHV